MIVDLRGEVDLILLFTAELEAVMRFSSGLAGFSSSSSAFVAVVPAASLSPHQLRQVHRTVCSCHSVALPPAHDVARILGSADRHTADSSNRIPGARQGHRASVCRSRSVLVCSIGLLISSSVQAHIGSLAASWRQSLRPMHVATGIVSLALIHPLYRKHLVFRAMALSSAVTMFEPLPGSSQIRERPTTWTRHATARLTCVLLILHVVMENILVISKMGVVVQQS